MTKRDAKIAVIKAWLINPPKKKNKPYVKRLNPMTDEELKGYNDLLLPTQFKKP
jgi:hypothetical protein